MDSYKIVVTEIIKTPSRKDTCNIEIRSEANTSTSSQIGGEDLQNILRFEAKLRWYIEEFGTEHPLETPEAKKASENLRKYASILFGALNTGSALPTQETAYHLSLQIEESSSVHSLFNRFRWEILQDIKKLPETSGISGISVLRIVNTCERQGHGGDDGVDPRTTANILAVTARPLGSMDIEHRLITRSILEVVQKTNFVALKAAKQGKTKANSIKFEISRPGTFDALKQCLTSQVVGFYNIVHLDLHGEVHDSSAFAVFVKRSTQEIDPNKPGERRELEKDLVPAKQLAEILVERQVKTVILNACRSAVEGEKPEANLARTLVQGGIETVIGMSYKVQDRSAGLFMHVLYDQLVSNNLPPLFAIQGARQYLIDHPSRLSKFNTSIEVDDYLVPTIYLRDSSKVLAGHSTVQKPPVLDVEQLGGGKAELIGREGDLLDIETKLLMSAPSICIQGDRGIGKSAMSISAGDWWAATGLVDRYITVDSSALRSDSLLNILDRETRKKPKATKGKAQDADIREMVENGESTSQSTNLEKDLKKRIKKRNILFIIDNVELTGQNPLTMADLERQVDFFRIFPSHADLSQSRRLVLIITRRKVSWGRLDKFITISHALKKWTPRSSIEYSTSILRLEKDGPKPPKPPTREDRAAIEQFGSFTQGNPLALKILLKGYCKSTLHPQQFLAALMRGKCIDLDENWLQNTPGAGSVHEVRRLLDHRPAAAYLLLPYWGRIDIPTLEGQVVYMYYDEESKSSGSRPSRSQVQQASFENVLNEEMEFLMVKDKSLPILASKRKELIQELNENLKPFIDAGFIVVEQPQIVTGRKPDKYYTLHPLLPLIIRTQQRSALDEDLKKCRKLIPKVFRYRTKSWPTDQLYFKKEWAEPRRIVEAEFYNFLAAAYFNIDAEGSALEDLMLQLMSGIVVKGILGDRTRHPLLATFWQFALEYTQKRKVHYQSVIVPSRRRLDLSALQDPNVVGALPATVLSILYPMNLVDYYTRNDISLATSYAQKAQSAFDTRIKIPLLDMTIVEAFRKPLEILAASRDTMNPQFNFGEEQMRVKMQAREAFYKRLERTGNNITGHLGEGGGSGVGMGMMGLGNSFLNQDEMVFMAILEARDTMSKREPETLQIRTQNARKKLEKVLLEELDRSPRAVNVSALHRTLSDVCEKGGLWENALYHWTEAIEIEKEERYKKSGKDLKDESKRQRVLERGARAARGEEVEYESDAEGDDGTEGIQAASGKKSRRCCGLFF